MRALTWQGNLDVRVTDVPDPRIQEPNDAIIAVTSTAICGSDLHLYGVLGPYLSPGDVLGHEAMGVVTEVGADVTNLAPGDRVVIPFNISCGHCWMCTRGLYAQCETTQVREQGKGAALFGYTSLYGSVPGGQAQFLRVPQAQFGPVKIPADGPDEQYLFLSDVLPTAYQAYVYADTPKDGTLAVLGLGPIGQFAARIARHLGVERVIGVDPVPERRAAAARFGIEAVDLNETADTAGMLIEMTGGRGRTRSSTRSAWRRTGTTRRPETSWPRWRSGPPACCRTGWRRRSPTWPRSTGWTRCTSRSRPCAAAAPSRSAASTAARSTPCR